MTPPPPTLEQGPLLANDATIDRVVDAFRPLEPTVIQTNLSKDNEQELVEALRA